MNRRKNKSRSFQPGHIESLEKREMFANGTAVVEFVDRPTEILTDDPVDIRVRFKLSDNSKDGPWNVNSLALRDDDLVLDDNIAEVTSLRITQQDTWYYHTFRDVDLASYVDFSNGDVELYARVKIDDNTFNFVDAKDSTPVYAIQAYADLTASRISLSDRTVEPGESIWVNFDVTNQGIARAGAMDTGIMFSSDASIGRGDRLVNTERMVLGLGAGNSRGERKRITIPNDAVIGETYYIGTIVDYAREINEGSGEGNNANATPQSITIVHPRADLVVDSISVKDAASGTTPPTFSPGQTIDVTTRIGNEGNSNAWNFNLEFYWSSSPGGTVRKFADNYIGLVRPDHSNPESADFTIGNVRSGTYYVTVVADSEDEVTEGNENNNVLSVPIVVHNPDFEEPREFAPGVTIITAGFHGMGTENWAPQEYTMEMAEAILERAYGDDTERGSVFISDPETGGWVNPKDRFNSSSLNRLCDDLNLNFCDSNLFKEWRENSNDPNDEIVLIYDWSWESNLLDNGWNEAAGDNLFASLVDDFQIGNQTINLLDRPMHFIGASRGTVVNTHAARRLDQHFPEVPIDHFTTLDPHPAQGPNGAISDYGSEDEILILPDNIVYADNFYRQDWSYELPDLDFNGVEVPGAVNLQLNEDVLDDDHAGAILEHKDVHVWYIATIVPNAAESEGYPVTEPDYDDWWTSGVAYDTEVEPDSGRANVGYAYSRVGGKVRHVDMVDHSMFTFATETTGVFNGDFEYGNRVLEYIPGWERHGGGGGGDLDGLSNRYLNLDRNDSTRTHNRMYFDANVTGIKFDFRVTSADAEDVLRVSVGDRTVTEIAVRDEHGDFVRDFTAPFNFDLPASVQPGFVDTLQFALVNPNGGRLQSQVRIDNVSLIAPVISLPSEDPLACDITGEGICDAADIDAIYAAIRTDSFLAAADFDKDGALTSDDADIWIGDLMNTVKGDADLDGSVNLSDFLAVSGNFGQQAGWASGDFDGNGSVALADFLVLSRNFGRHAVAGEPLLTAHDEALAALSTELGPG